MSKPSRFGGLSARVTAKTERDVRSVPAEAASPQADPAVKPKPAAAEAERSASIRPKSREGKKLIAGHFSDALSKQLRMQAAREGTSVQALMGEAFDLLFENRGINRFGER